MELYGDAIVTLVSVVMCVVFLGICMSIYRNGVVCLLDSIMYGG